MIINAKMTKDEAEKCLRWLCRLGDVVAECPEKTLRTDVVAALGKLDVQLHGLVDKAIAVSEAK